MKPSEVERLNCRSFLDASPYVMIMLDKSLHYIAGTDELARQSFRLKDQTILPGLSLDALFQNFTNSKWIRRVQSECRSAIGSGERRYLTEIVETSEGESKHMQIVLSPAKDCQGDMCGLVFLLNDITELVIAREEALGASRAKSNFLSNMSHEIRTPMNAIVGMSNLLNLTELNDSQKAYVQNLMTACDSLVSLINDILDFSMIDSKKIDITPREYSLQELLNDVANTANLKADEKRIAFTTYVDPQLPARLFGDDLRVKQILSNLLANAVQFTDDGSVTLKVSGIVNGDMADMRFEVIDTGIGIKPDKIESMFRAFSHLDNDKRRTLQGTGLGLALSTGIARAMGGEITVKSIFGEGSEFVLNVPQKPLTEKPVASIEDPSNKRALVFGDDIKLKAVLKMIESLFIPCDFAPDDETFGMLINKQTYSHLFFKESAGSEKVRRELQRLRNTRKAVLINLASLSADTLGSDMDAMIEPVLIYDVARILNLKNIANPDKDAAVSDTLGSVKTEGVVALVVDDNEINLIVAEEMLSHYGMRVDTALSGTEALEMVRNRAYDIVFMDHMMPEMDGIEVTKCMRAEGGHCAQMPIIALTANAVTGVKDLFLHSGLNDYISKPIEIDELDRVLFTHLPDKSIVEKAAEPPSSSEDALHAEYLKAIATHCDVKVTEAVKQVGGSEATYLIILETFMTSILRKIELLHNYYMRDDIVNFRIEVHGQKSALFNVGARAASEQARKLELAAVNENREFIDQHLNEYLDALRKLESSIRQYMPSSKHDDIPVNARKATIDDMLTLKRVLMEISAAVDDLTPDRALLRLDSLKNIDFGEEISAQLSGIRQAVNNFDYDKACELIAAMHDADA